MKIKIPKNSNLVIAHTRDYMELEIEEMNDTKEDILKSILDDDGVKTLVKCLDNDDFVNILNHFEDDLHDHLESCGYIFSKA